MLMKSVLLASAALAALLGAAQAQPAGTDVPNLQRLQQFRQSATPVEMQTVPQTGEQAEQIKKNLARITLPQGFKIGLYAIVPDARHMAVGPNVGAVFVGTRKSNVWVVTDRDKDRHADEVKTFAPSIGMKMP